MKNQMSYIWRPLYGIPCKCRVYLIKWLVCVCAYKKNNVFFIASFIFLLTSHTPLRPGANHEQAGKSETLEWDPSSWLPHCRGAVRVSRGTDVRECVCCCRAHVCVRTCATTSVHAVGDRDVLDVRFRLQSELFSRWESQRLNVCVSV